MTSRTKRKDFSGIAERPHLNDFDRAIDMR